MTQINPKKAKRTFLNDKQQAFVRAYCNPKNNYNATRAYCEAYGICYQRAYRSAQVGASKLLSKSIIQRAIDNERKRILERHDDMVDTIIQQWLTIGTTDITQLLDIQGQTVKLKEFSEVPPHLLMCIKSVKNTAHGVDVTFHDKLRALENLAKTLGMFTTVVHNTNEPYESLVEKIERQRKAAKQS